MSEPHFDGSRRGGESHASGRRAEAGPPPSRRRGRSLLLSTVISGSVLAAALPAAAAADDCSNAAFRAGAGADLPDCRAYELVSPADKAAGIVAFPAASQGHSSAQGGVSQASPDGETAAFWSYQAFSDAASGLLSSYRSRRTADGWITKAWSPRPPPMDPAPNITTRNLINDATEDLTKGFFRSELPYDPLVQRPFTPAAFNYIDVYSVGSDGAVTWESRPNGATPVTAAESAVFAGRSGDGGAVIFQTREPLVPEASSQVGGRSLYLRAGGVTTLISADDDPAVSTCGAVATVASFNDIAPRRAISEDGSRIFFTAPDPQAAFSGPPSCDAPAEIYVRDGGTVRAASASQRTVPDTDASAQFQAATPDGSALFFTSDEALTDDADPTRSASLYRYDVASGDLTLLTPAGDVAGVVAVDDDGSHVYYVVGSELRVSVDGVSTRVADISDVNRFGMPEIMLWLTGKAPVRITPDGRYLAFEAYTNLGAFAHPGVAEIYRYDSQADEMLCVSCNRGDDAPLGDAIFSSNGNDVGVGVPTFTEPRNISDDGRRIVFDTVDRLDPRDGNGVSDVYEWVDGETHLISDGQSRDGSFYFDSDEDGTTIFFATSSSLVGQDVDNGAQDVYAARIGGGFPAPPVTPDPCRDGCQGDGRQPPADLGIGTDFPRPVDPEDDEPRFRAALRFTLARPSRAARSGFSRSGSIVLRVRTNGAARVTAAAQVKRRGKTRTLARTTRRASKAATVRVKVALSRRARAQLASGATVTVRVTVQGVAKAQTLRLRYAGAKR